MTPERDPGADLPGKRAYLNPRTGQTFYVIDTASLATTPASLINLVDSMKALNVLHLRARLTFAELALFYRLTSAEAKMLLRLMRHEIDNVRRRG